MKGLLVVAALATALTALPAPAIGGEVVVIVNANSPLSDVSSADLRKIWLGKAKKIGDIKVLPHMSDDMADARTVFFAKVLEKTERQLKKYYLKEQLRGGAIPPKSESTVVALMQKVASDKSAIGFADRTAVEKAKTTGVKSVKVDGKLPGDAGYVLK